MIKLLRRFSFVILVALQLAFIIAVFHEDLNKLSILSFIGVLCFLALFSIIKNAHNSSSKPTQGIIILIMVFLGSIITYYINYEFQTGTVIAAALLGTISSFIPSILNRRNSEFINEIPKALYCGAFVGMTSSAVSGGYIFILIAGLFAGFLYIASTNSFIGIGGKLGTIAFGGVATAFIITLLFS
jgi:hypothetical protein